MVKPMINPSDKIQDLMSNEEIPLNFYQILEKLNKSITLEECRDFISTIPDRVIKFFYEKFSIELDATQNKFFDKYREFYYGMALYLDNLVLHNPKNSNLKYFKYSESFAKCSKRILELASSLEKEHWLLNSFHNPKHLWLNCEMMLFRDALEYDGMLANLGLDNKIPYLIGETEFRNKQKRFSEVLDPHNPKYYEKNDFNAFYKIIEYENCSIEEMNICVRERPLYYLVYETYLKAHNNTDYYNEFFNPFLKALASVRNSSKSPNVYYSILSLTGEILSTEKHKNRRNP